MPPSSLFHIPSADGSLSEPHHAGFLCRSLAAGELDPQTCVRLKGTPDRLSASRGAGELERLRPRRAPAAWRKESGSFPRGHTARRCQGAALAVCTVALSIPASVFLHHQMAAAGLACLLAMAGCLAGALVLLDPLRK